MNYILVEPSTVYLHKTPVKPGLFPRDLFPCESLV
jgi:hypothetical protein